MPEGIARPRFYRAQKTYPFIVCVQTKIKGANEEEAEISLTQRLKSVGLEIIGVKDAAKALDGKRIGGRKWDVIETHGMSESKESVHILSGEPEAIPGFEDRLDKILSDV